MADDKTTKTPEQPVTDSGPGKETPPAPPKEPEKVSVSPEPEKKTEPEVKNPQVSVYNFAEIMKEKNVEERSAAPSGEKPAPAKTEKPEKQPEVICPLSSRQVKYLKISLLNCRADYLCMAAFSYATHFSLYF